LKKKLKIQDFMDKTKKIGTLSFSPWAVLATWLNIEAIKKLQEK
jgi:hypothetical protein